MNQRCTQCPELTLNKSYWCPECKAQEDYDKFQERMETLRKSLKNLMKPTPNIGDPNWEDFSHPHEG